jgi:hypothetical protein
LSAINLLGQLHAKLNKARAEKPRELAKGKDERELRAAFHSLRETIPQDAVVIAQVQGEEVVVPGKAYDHVLKNPFVWLDKVLQAMKDTKGTPTSLHLRGKLFGTA